AQLSSFITLRKLTDQAFMGFVGVDGVKFRGQVTPGDRLLILCRETQHRPRRCTCLVQGLVDGQLVFEAIIKGMPM
ncbi:MAG: beta-hydroxyacyl-ACP dehydratase, partial [Planctomycetota bacterium]